MLRRGATRGACGAKAPTDGARVHGGGRRLLEAEARSRGKPKPRLLERLQRHNFGARASASTSIR
eukprot:6778146-Pyramimonas_sp.AAC.1